ncbi:MAG: hypothetical protein EOO12_02625 [Chitinophagaceae bacterium]|nr:MAG: hypothetical protein EOO12_02625 [Chitinophagaceae bacterium]
MRLLGSVLLCLGFVACSGDPKKEPEAKGAEPAGGSFAALSAPFTTAPLPYSLNDSSVLNTKDTAALSAPEFASLLPDTLRAQLLGGGNVRFTPLARIEGAQDVRYLSVRASSGSRRAALLYRFEKDSPAGVFPLLVPDADPATAQVSTIDRAGAITRGITKKLPKEQTAEGKEVFMYNAEGKNFTLIGADPLEDNQDVLNPLDTFARTHPLAGDYIRNPRNFVSIRDARNPNELNFFVHFETGEDDNTCVGELKGTALLTSSKTAVYRQGGDPCVLELTFQGNNVTLREMEGCGSRRGVQCVFEGSFPRKKPVSPKSPAKKKSKK